MAERMSLRNRIVIGVGMALILSSVCSLGCWSQELRYGFIDRSGQLVIQPQFDKAYPFTEGLSFVAVGGKWGCIDRTGNFVIKPRFDAAQSFSEGLAAVEFAALRVSADDKGNAIVEPVVSRDGATSQDVNSESRQKEIEGPGAFVDLLGNLAIKPVYAHWEKVKNGLRSQPAYIANVDAALAGSDSKDAGQESMVYDLGTVNVLTVSPQFRDPQPFSEGLAAVKMKVEIGGNNCGGYFDWKFGYIDRTGKVTIKPRFDKAYPFSDGLALVRIAHKWGGN